MENGNNNWMWVYVNGFSVHFSSFCSFLEFDIETSFF